MITMKKIQTEEEKNFYKSKLMTNMKSSQVKISCTNCHNSQNPFSSSSSLKCSDITNCLLCQRLNGDPQNIRLLNNDTIITEDCSNENQGFCINNYKFCDYNNQLNCPEFSTIKMRERVLNNLHKRKSRGSSRCASSVVRWFSSGHNLPFLTFFVFFYLILLSNSVLNGFAQSTTNSTSTNGTTNKSPTHRKDRDEHVCQSIDIRNSVTQLESLQHCTVVEGFVQILLIDHAHEKDFANYTFPDLIEITGYLALYRVDGLRSIGHLFPNLAIIRGFNLFINYALVAFEMQHLQEIGLHSLTDIQKGSVRFEKNPALCYVDTIDWDAIAKTGKGDNIISGNKPRNACPVCERRQGCLPRLTKKDDYLCWNAQHCQKICDRECGDSSCMATGNCCDSECVGGCTDITARDCIACKHVVQGDKVCVPTCSPQTFVFMNRRCVSKDLCLGMKKPRESLPDVMEFPYKPFQGRCEIECPPGYTVVVGEPYCTKCTGQCEKKCPSTNVDSIAKIQSLRGCTVIEGSLEIQIRGGKNIVKELEDNLNSIQTINGYLKVVRSFPLISLNFLRNLRHIKGELLDNGKYILSVLDNQNLQALWSWKDRPPIKLGNSDNPPKVFFHFNPKLCLQNIEILREKSGLLPFTDLEVAPNSNGDKVACNVTELHTFVTKRTSEAALIQWNAFEHHDPRSLLGYVVYFIEAPVQDVKMYDARDACGGDGWRVDDVSTDSSEGKAPPFLTHILTQLKPYTQYAFYVKTYTIATERSGAQSNVHYFTTLPGTPTAPRALNTWSNSSNEMVMIWLPPLRANGNLTHYRIVGRLELDDPSFLAKRNYCDEPMSPEKKTASFLAEEERKRIEAEKDAIKPADTSCDCTDHEAEQSLREKEVTSSIAFEDALHNQVYIKRINSRRKREIEDNIGDDNDNENNNNNKPESKIMNLFRCRRNAGNNLSINDKMNKTSTIEDKIENNTYTVFHRLIPAGNLTFVMKQLRHFGAYNIEISACREPVPNDTSPICSTKGMRTHRTLPLESADDIPKGTFKYTMSGGNDSQRIVKLEWAEPIQPNGQIITYQIVYKRIDIENIQATTVCITRHDFINSDKSYTLKDLPAGNYSVKIKATSLAGSGSYSSTLYFLINEVNNNNYLSLIILGIIIFIFCIFVIGVIIIKSKYLSHVSSMRLIATVNPEYVSSHYIADNWEIPREKVQTGRALGNGSFGMVYEGIVKDLKETPEKKCAIKTVANNASERQRMDFLNEASVMKAFDTHHVIKLLGVVSIGQPPLVIMELMGNGDLKAYLRSHRPEECHSKTKRPPTLQRILRMALEIADGMAYLSAKKFVHRDLAARNCMVAEDLTVKVGDFGMTRDIYETDYYRKGNKGFLPVRWMSPESLKDGVFTIYSDVWSYGVVLWEMVTLASQPYQGLSNDQVLKYVIECGVMEKPENCPDRLYGIMRQTWNQRPSQRIPFSAIVSLLLSHGDPIFSGFEKVSFFHTPQGIEAHNANLKLSPDVRRDDSASMQELYFEEESENNERSPLHVNSDFANSDPMGMQSSMNSNCGSDGDFDDQDHIIGDYHNNRSDPSIVPLKNFHFDGASGCSLASSKGTLDFPFVEDSLQSVRTSPSIPKNSFTPRSNISPISGNNSINLREKIDKLTFDNNQSNENNKIKKNNDCPDYENHNPEVMASLENKDIQLRINFTQLDERVNLNGILNDTNEKDSDYTEKMELSL